jgi:S1-C subfamily serine protease
VWVTSDAFVTARHCTRGLRAGDTVGYVTRADVDEREDIVGMRLGVLVAKDAKHDLALVRDKGAPAHGVASISEPVVGRSAAAMGHSLGLWWSYSRGEVAAVRIHEFDSDGPVWWVQATTPISPGNSGGGLFDSEGSLIGIAAGILRGGESLNLFVHSRYVAALLKAEGSQ